MECQITADGVILMAQFDSRAIGALQMERVLRQFENVLGQIIHQRADLKLANVSFTCPEELRELDQAAGARRRAVDDTSLHSLCEQRVRRQPGAQAICSWDGDFSYEELWTLSALLRDQLVAAGIGPGSVVALCFEKSAFAVVAMLGALMAGGAFMALDPAHPIGRLEHIVTKAKAALVVTSLSLAHLFRTSPFEVHELSRDTLQRVTQPGTRHPAGAATSSTTQQSSDPAVIIFTSGSTGKPKGIVLPHSSIVSSCLAHIEPYGLNTESRVLQFAAYTFDESIEDVFSTLIAGGTICIPSDVDRLNDLSGAINRLRANWAILTPTVASLIEPEDVSSLKTIGFGGEPATKTLISKWKRHARLMNVYGPAECSMAAVCNPELADTDPACIGRPVGGRAWVVDSESHDRLCALGAIGELLIEGPLLATGYLNDEARTAAAFIEFPVWATEGASSSGSPAIRSSPASRRFYKTGDLVWIGDDLKFYYVGRKDTQVKLHGQRIELTEIEHQISRAGTCHNVVVCMPRIGPCRGKLCAVWVPVEGEETNSTEGGRGEAAITPWTDPTDNEVERIEEHLRRIVPPYMIPSVWVAVGRLPLLSSGKINRRAVSAWLSVMTSETLRDIGRADGSSETSTLDEAIDDTEMRLRAVWADVLNIKDTDITLHKSFLRMGGDSISAIQVVTRCRANKLGVTVQDVLRCRGISDLAKHVRELDQIAAVPVDAAERKGVPFGLSPVQNMFVRACSGIGSAINHYNQSFLLRLGSRMVAEDIGNAISLVANHHPMTHARFCQDDDGTWKQYVTDDEAAGSYSFSVHYVEHEADILPLIRASQQSLDIQQGPLFKAHLFEVGRDQQQQLLFLVAHHLIIDLVSWRIVLEDLEEALRNGEVTSQKTTPFSLWCRLQDSYVRRQLDEIRKQLPFHVDRGLHHLDYWEISKENNTYADMESQSFTLSDHTTQLLLSDANQAFGTEPLDLMLGVLMHSFSEVFTDRAPPVIYNEGHGRQTWDSTIDLSRTVGWFTTMLPISVPRAEDIADAVRRVKDLRRSVPDHGWSWFSAEFLSREDEGGPCPPMEIILNYAGQYQQLERDGAILSRVQMDDLEAMDVGPRIPRPATFEISAGIESGRLRFMFYYNCQVKKKAQIQDWVAKCEGMLEEACTKLQSLRQRKTLSDLPLLPMTYDALSHFEAATDTQTGLCLGSDVEDAYPCVSMQQGLLLSRIRDSGVYHIANTWEVRPQRSPHEYVDPSRLKTAWLEVVERHPALRTMFIEFQAQGLPSETVPFVQAVLHTDAIRREDYATCFVHPDPVAALLEQGEQRRTLRRSRRTPLPQHLSICRSPDGRVFAKLEIDHLVVDGSSMSVLLRDLALAYEGKLLSIPTPLRYRDYVDYLGRRNDSHAVEYWDGYLRDLSPTIFPTNTADDSGNEVKGRDHEGYGVNLSQSSELSSACERMGITLAALFQTAWAMVLASFTEQQDVCFGYLASGRDTPLTGIENAVGLFVNLLVCRCNLNPKARLQQTVDSVQADLIRGMSHQHCSLAEIQHRLDLPEATSLFNTIMSFQRRSSHEDHEDAAISFEMVSGRDPTEVRGDTGRNWEVKDLN
jgi:amino acid adenylation domain-containing protein/non-ribosomal peptide synthase protein (TIGR01720 family)